MKTIDDIGRKHSVRLAEANLEHALEILDAGTEDGLAWEEIETDTAALARDGLQVVEFHLSDLQPVQVPFRLGMSPEMFVKAFVGQLETMRDELQRAIDGIAKVCPAARNPAKRK